jgi:hypothetical protein
MDRSIYLNTVIAAARIHIVVAPAPLVALGNKTKRNASDGIQFGSSWRTTDLVFFPQYPSRLPLLRCASSLLSNELALRAHT